MKNKHRKNRQGELANRAIKSYISLLTNRFFPPYDHLYVKEIRKHAQAFNIRLTREEKLLFCKYCSTYQGDKNQIIRLHPQRKTKEFICRNCGARRRIPYK